MRFGHGELHLVLLALLSQRPMHGYELMTELSKRIRRYRPSPGSIYPAIQALETEGLIAGTDEGDRRIFALTSEGTQALVNRQNRLAALEARLGVRFADGLDATLARFGERVRNASKQVDIEAIEAALDRTATEIESLATSRRVL
jgi:DNA-binding PadR family transcriptional regulator